MCKPTNYVRRWGKCLLLLSAVSGGPCFSRTLRAEQVCGIFHRHSPVCALDLYFRIVFSSKLSNNRRSQVPYKVQHRIPYRRYVAYRWGPLCRQLNRKHGLLLPPAASQWASLTANGHKTPVQHNTTKRLPGPEFNTQAQSHSKTRNSPNEQTCSYDGVLIRMVRTCDLFHFHKPGLGFSYHVGQYWGWVKTWQRTSKGPTLDPRPRREEERWKSGVFLEGFLWMWLIGRLKTAPQVNSMKTF